MIGSMRSMMVMGWRRGREEAGIAASTGRVSGMDMGSIGSTPETSTPESGRAGRAMGVEFIPVRMGVDMLESSSGVSSMVLATTISGISI